MLRNPNWNESIKEKEKMQRNERKLDNSTKEYEQLNNKCFEAMVRILTNRFKLVTPTVGR